MKKKTLNSKSKIEHSRREFILNFAKGIGALAVGFPAIVPRSVFGQSAPSNRIVMGFIGCGKQSMHLLRSFLNKSETQVVALCDVDKLKLNRDLKIATKFYTNKNATGHTETIKTYGDYRELLARQDIDAVCISTPDHWHGLNVVHAAKAGKDIYCEKPLVHNILEGKDMVKAVRRYGRVFQTGSMQRSDAKFRHACELVRNGYIGDIQHVAVNISGPPRPCDLPSMPIPDYLDWDMWQGPALKRPYHSELSPHISKDVFPNWRNYKDYGGGGMTDWGAHHFDIAQWGLGMDRSGPIEVIPPNEKDINALTYRYANGTTMSRTNRYDNMRVRGILFIGTKGKIMVDRGFLKTWPENLVTHQIRSNEIHLYSSVNHTQDFLDSIKTRKEPICDVEVGYSTVVVCHMGNIAYELKRPLTYNQKQQKFVNDTEANKLMGRPMRSPWGI